MKKLQLLIVALCCITVNYAQQVQDPMEELTDGQVTVYDSAKAQPGINLADGTNCFFFTMAGKPVTDNDMYNLHLKYVNTLPDGNFAGCSDSLLVKFSGGSEIIWAVPAPEIHHEITADDSGNIYLLSYDYHEFMGATVRFDVIKAYNPEGVLIYKWCSYDHLEEFTSIISKSAWLKDLAIPYSQCKNAAEYILQYPNWFFCPSTYPLKSYLHEAFCVFEFSHFNSIQVLPENEVSKKIPAFKKGNLLICFNPYSCYGILNPSTGKIEWVAYLPERTTLHTPLLTPAGTILVFQNRTDASAWYQIQHNETDNEAPVCSFPEHTLQHPVWQPRAWVSVTEYDPLTNSKIWEYTANPKESWVADLLGSAQRLPNGNTLITTIIPGIGKGSRVFEVSPEKEIVWDFTSKSRNTFFRVKRVPLGDNLKQQK